MSGVFCVVKGNISDDYDMCFFRTDDGSRLEAERAH